MDFRPFPKIPRLMRDIIVTEKIDGTNASIFVPDDPAEQLLFGSRTRWITPEDDNFGFAKWGTAHADELRELGPGHHFGEWYGCGIQRSYGLKEKRFALFNVSRWGASRPACCDVVPVLYQGQFSDRIIEMATQDLSIYGSVIVPGFMRPEGVVVYHTAAGTMFKRTLEKDEAPKGTSP